MEKQRVLSALLSQPNQRQAAKAAGISERTLYKILRDPEFSRMYRDALDAMMQESTREARLALSPAIATLRSICEDKSAGSMSRISAARSLLEYGLRLVEQNNILKRIGALEDAAEKKY